jgi:hypothetical protein
MIVLLLNKIKMKNEKRIYVSARRAEKRGEQHQ